MQQPTCTMLRVRSVKDAEVLFHAVKLGILPKITRRLDTEERRAITSGCVFVWEERGTNGEATGLGIERWTDGKRWGPSRVRDDFLFYQEKEPEPIDLDLTSDSDTTFGPGSRAHPSFSRNYIKNSLVKQTYSVFIETPQGRRKWHLVAYFTHDTVNHLRCIADIAQLANMPVPEGIYRSARHNPVRGGARGETQEQLSNHPQYAAYPSPIRTIVQEPHSATSHSHARYDPHRARSASPGTAQLLAPLAYLQNIPPPRRHPLDEEALMSFFPGFP